MPNSLLVAKVFFAAVFFGLGGKGESEPVTDHARPLLADLFIPLYSRTVPAFSVLHDADIFEASRPYYLDLSDSFSYTFAGT